MKRRSFLKGSILAAISPAVQAESIGKGEKDRNIIATPPVLQNPASSTMDVVWGVNSRATGFVDVANNAAMQNHTRFYAGASGLRTLDELAIGVRMQNLQPNSTYYYQTGTLPINFNGPYKISAEEPVLSKVRSFKTPGIEADSSFGVINDTHEDQVSFARLAAKLDELDPAVTVWNGDLCNHFSDLRTMQQVLLNAGNTEFAASRPMLFTPGNHDFRGICARELHRFIMPRAPEERENRFWQLNRNYAIRQGQIALIGMDTGEDKPDWHKAWGSLAEFTPYREMQTSWLSKTLEEPAIRSAPYIVVFCHIPLFDSVPDSNPGDLAEGYAYWHKHCAEMWSPLFEKHRVQLVVTAHMHRYRYDPPSNTRSWAQIVNGPGILSHKTAKELTVLSGKVKGSHLEVEVHNLISNSVLGSFKFEPRNC